MSISFGDRSMKLLNKMGDFRSFQRESNLGLPIEYTFDNPLRVRRDADHRCKLRLRPLEMLKYGEPYFWR